MDYTKLKIADYKSLYSILPNTTDEDFLELYLSFVKSYLSSSSVIFKEGETAISINRFSTSTRQTIFSIPFVKKADLEKVSYFNNDTEEVLTFLTDYTLEGNKEGYISIIRLLNKTRVFYSENYLEITGLFGFEEIPGDLHFVFLELFAGIYNNRKKNLSMLDNDGRDLSSLRAGNITYNFSFKDETSTNTNIMNIFKENQTLSKIINSYNII